eukprot:2896584-Prymnesium_polylepis.2
MRREAGLPGGRALDLMSVRKGCKEEGSTPATRFILPSAALGRVGALRGRHTATTYYKYKSES